MRLEDDSPASELVLQAIREAVLPAAVRSAWTGPRPAVAPGQLWRAQWDEVTRFVVVLQIEGLLAEVAPISIDVDQATDDAYLLEAAETDFDVPVAVWLGLKAIIPTRVLAHYAGSVHIAVDALRKAPQGRPVLSPIDERALEAAVLGDDMDELAEVPAAAATLQQLLSEVTIKDLVGLQIPTPHALAIRRGVRPLTPVQAAKVAPLARTTAEALLRANPPLPAEVVRDLDAPEVHELVAQLAARRGIPDADARLMAGYGAYGLAARETGPGSVDWTARIVAYVRALLGGDE